MVPILAAIALADVIARNPAVTGLLEVVRKHVSGEQVTDEDLAAIDRAQQAANAAAQEALKDS